MTQNLDIRFAARAAQVPLWKVAKSLNISEPTLYRWLRDTLTEARHSEIMNAIHRIASERKT